MSKINPNNNAGILVDDFISLAIEHLLSVEGGIATIAAYPTGPAPSFVRWKGYQCVPASKTIVYDVNEENNPEFWNTDNIKGKTNTTINSEYIDVQITESDLIAERLPVDYTTASPSPISNIKTSIPNTSIANTKFVATNDEAREAIQNYLGRPITDEEYSNLIAATYAEAGKNQTERAYVMAVILNRTRQRYTPSTLYKGGRTTITDILRQPAQFQAVTGIWDKSAQSWTGPSKWFLQGPDTENLKSIFGAAKKILPTVGKDYIGFTSNIEAAYGTGTNIGYLYTLRSRVASGQAIIIGSSIFTK